mmetsp:Transcript_22758/g.56222  ORF Transcript_22758/g.56222 Transcript_22758/m.56222 type:complete len:578 (+) Transcript_22758:164-1897(+)
MLFGKQATTFLHILLLSTSSLAAPELSADLANKLDHQFEKFDNGRSFLVDAIVNNGTTVSRDEWEQILSPDEDFSMTESDMEALRSYHAEIIEEASLRAVEDSPISIDDFRSDDDAVKQFCRNFPRAALVHIHPGGTLKSETVDHLFNEINPIVDSEKMIEIGKGERTMLYPAEVEFLEGLTSGLRYLEHSEEDQNKIRDFLFLPKEPCCHEFPRFEALFSLKNVLLQDQNASYYDETLYKDFLERTKSYGIDYVELTITRVPPSLEKLKELDDFLVELSSNYNMTVNYNVAFIRAFAAEMNNNFTTEFLEAMSSPTGSAFERTVGIDLLAEEANHPAFERAQGIYIPIFDAWKSEKIPLNGMVMHAGESGQEYAPRNVRDGIIMGVTRIGHGPLLDREPLLMEYARRKQTAFAMSLVSNWRLKVIIDDTISNHPFLKFIRLGMPLSLSTDDEGMFHTDIVNECVVAIQNFDIQYSELKGISYTAVTSSLADNSTKEALLEQLDSEFEAFERVEEASLGPTNAPTESVEEASLGPSTAPTESVEEASLGPSTAPASSAAALIANFSLVSLTLIMALY